MNSSAVYIELAYLVTCYSEPNKTPRRDKQVHDAHGLRQDACAQVDLLEHLVHKDGVAFLHGLSLLLAALTGGLGHGLL